ncbi:MAG: hypothetical protein ACRD12_08210, partial [Acidimicrobiales bacterium]
MPPVHFGYGYFPTNWEFVPGSTTTSENDKYQVRMQTDGNFVVYDQTTGDALWDTKTTGPGVHHAIMQSDGNFVIYDNAGASVWESNTDPQPNYACFLRLQDDGN